ncbi:MAG: PilZ domain-containing protein [Methylobacterium mesophilicum]|nr:PilZ domain-containing protein [Methylobacterium mesophilicum]
MSLLKNVTPEMASDDDAERRIAPRIKTLKRAKVYFNNMNSTFDCVVRNISSTGALLTLDESAHLPREFGVRIGEMKELRPARLVYRRGMLAGIHFLDSPEQEEIAAPHAADDAQPASSLPEPAPEVVRRIVAQPLPQALTRNVRWF